MAIRVGINGFGRIGRLVFRNLMARSKEFEVVAINDLTDNHTLATLLKYDSTHRRYPGTVTYDDKYLTVDGKKIHGLKERDPAKLPWGELNVDVVVESTGIFTARETHQGRQDQAGLRHAPEGRRQARRAQRPGQGRRRPDLRDGRQRRQADQGPEVHLERQLHDQLPGARWPRCCNDKFGIVKGLMTTVHAYTNDQRLQDLPHDNLYRAAVGRAEHHSHHDRRGQRPSAW